MGAETSHWWHRTGAGELKAVWVNRRALWSLTVHDLRRMYAGTAGGTLWTFLTPLIPILIYSTVFSLALKLPLGGAPYVFGFTAAYVPWLLLSSSVYGATGSLIEHRYLVKRVLFPVGVIPVDSVLVSTVPHVLLVTLASVACLVGGYGGLPELLLVAYFYVCAVALAIGVGLLFSSLTVVVRDFQQVLPSAMQAWFWLSPVAWDNTQFSPRVRALLALNPAVYIVTGYRHALMPKVFAAPTAFEAAAFWGATLALLLLGATCFRRLRVHFWDSL